MKARHVIHKAWEIGAICGARGCVFFRVFVYSKNGAVVVGERIY